VLARVRNTLSSPEDTNIVISISLLLMLISDMTFRGPEIARSCQGRNISSNWVVLKDSLPSKTRRGALWTFRMNFVMIPNELPPPVKIRYVSRCSSFMASILTLTLRLIIKATKKLSTFDPRFHKTVKSGFVSF